MGHVAEAECLKCREEEETPDHIVFQCEKIKRIKDVREEEGESGLVRTR